MARAFQGNCRISGFFTSKLGFLSSMYMYMYFFFSLFFCVWVLEVVGKEDGLFEEKEGCVFLRKGREMEDGNGKQGYG